MNYEAVFPTSTYEKICSILLRQFDNRQKQEVLCFCLWRPGRGHNRYTAIVSKIIEPKEGDGLVHGNVSFSAGYLSRALRLAIKEEMGLGFMHNHLNSGWQDLSELDLVAERDRIAPLSAATGFPLIGFTMGIDGFLNARFWFHRKQRMPEWCRKVRVVGGKAMDVFYNESKYIPYTRSTRLNRTIDSWGFEMQCKMARLRLGIVGVGSVGSMISETLARMGMTDITLIDQDRIKVHNLDRLVNAGSEDIGEQKVRVAAKYAKRAASAKEIRIRPIANSIENREALGVALDCDILFCSVDRPLPKDLLNQIAYAHCIPVIFTGIYFGNKPDGRLSNANWSVSIHAPGSRCLRCDGQYSSSDVIQEVDGSLQNPEYVRRQDNAISGSRGQNVFPFSANLASFAVLEMVRYLIAENWWENGILKTTYYFPRARQECMNDLVCRKSCSISEKTGAGEKWQYPFLI